MNETAFETIAQAAAVLKLDFSSAEFAALAEENALSEDEPPAAEGSEDLR